MSRSARTRASRRRIQPYSWLGAGAVTLGMGVAIVGGTAVAFADTGADSSGSSGAGSAASSQNDSPSRNASRASRGSAANDSSAATPRRGQVAAVVEAPAPEPEAPIAIPETTAPVAETASPVAEATEAVPAAADTAAAVPVVDESATAVPAEAPAAANDSTPEAAATTTSPRAAQSTSDTSDAARGSDSAQSDSVPVVNDSTAPEDADIAEVAETAEAAVSSAAADTAEAAAADPAAADPAPSMVSWLPGGDNPGEAIVPGAHVKLALDEIAATQGILTQQTWGSGNFLAGIGAIAPQVMLAAAQLALQAWQIANPAAQDFLASVAGIPILHQIAQANLISSMLLPTLSDISMAGAALLIPTLSWVGADVSTAETTLAAARQDGKVYAIVPITTKLNTEPMAGVSINGGSKASLLIDTGASGVVTTRDKVGAGDLGEPIGGGNSCFSGGLCYHYETYNTTVDLGGGATAVAPVNIVTDNEEYPDSVANFKQFFSWGADGILGIGANTAGPGPAPVATAAMPGELSDGVLVFQNLFFGLGVMILGPNPLPTKVSVPGAPDAYVQVSVNGGEKTLAGAIIDSGGVYGTLPVANAGGLAPAGSYLPAGTKISVYTADGSTLLYSYTTGSGSQGTPVIASGLMNTGNAPYAQGPIYLNYGYQADYGIGSTDFSIW